MDAYWKMEEALMTIRDGIQLTPAQESRMRVQESVMQVEEAKVRRPRDPRRAAASVLLALARRLDPESAPAAWASERVQRHPA